MNGLMDRLNDMLKKDKFGSEFKNAMKRHNFIITDKIGDFYTIADGFTVDISRERREYEAAPEKLDEIIAKIERECDMEKRMATFNNGQEFLRLVVVREKDITSDMVTAEFVGGLYKTIVYTSDDMTLHRFDEKIAKRWGMPREVLFSVADRNMCRLLAKTKVKKTDLSEGVTAMEFDIPCRHLGVSFMLCNDFRRAVYEYMGAKFLVVAPSCESLIILENITNNILEKLGKEIVREYKKSASPLTTDVFLFTPDKIQIAGHFSVKNPT